MGNLVAPIMPVESTIGLEAIMRGFQGLAANRRYAQGVQLQLQQMAQQEQLRQQEFGLEQQRIDNQYQVQQEQIKNYQSLETERSQKLKEARDALNSVGPMVKDLANIPTDIRGTPEHENALALIQDKYATTGVFDTARGQQVWRGANLDLLRNQRQLNYTNGVLNKQYTQAFANKGLDPAIGDYLQTDKDGKFQKNDIWGTNDDGSVYVAVGPGTSSSGAIIPGGGGVIKQDDPILQKPAADQANIRFRTFTAGAAKQLLQLKQKRDKLTNMLTGSPTDTTQPATDTAAEAAPQMNQGGQGQVDLKALAQQALDDPNASPEHKRAAQVILASP